MTFSSRIGPVAGLAIVLASLTTQATSASAAALPRAGAHAQATRPAATRPGRVRSHPAAVIRPKIKSAPGYGLTSRPPARNASHHPAFGSAAAIRARRAAAFRVALAATQVPDTCSGLIQPDTIYPCTTPSSTGTDTFTLSLTSSTDLLLFQILDSTGNELSFTVTAPDSSTLNCQQPTYFQMPQCQTSQAGTYTLQVQNGGGSYTLAFRPLLSDTSCAVASPSFAAAALTAKLAAGGVGACYTLAMTSGQILHANSTSQNIDLLVTVYDSTGTQICFDNQGDCPLTGTGPYFVEADAESADAIKYDLELNDITNPHGCLTARLLAYGSAPDTSSANRCRTLIVGKAGQYQVYAISPQQGILTSTLYHPDGRVDCTNTYSSTAGTCRLAAGSYNLVADPYPGSPADLGAVFIAGNESRGCKLTPDAGFAAGPATGKFTGTGEEICLTLPATVGHAMYLLNEPAAHGFSPQFVVIDAKGAQTCQDNGSLFNECALTGTAPFRIILSGEPSGDGYRVLVQASDSTKGCRVWPQSGFGGSWGATVKLTPARVAACLSIPARQHSTGEMIDYSNLKNFVDGSIYVYSPAGQNICIGASTSICSYKRGVTYTALVIGATDTYHLVRRDVSRTAHCSKPASTVPGGRSTTVQLTSDLDTRCLRVTGPAADKFSFDIRAAAPNAAGAILQVTDARGVIVCGQYSVICHATGSASYQLLVTALGYQGIAITVHVDAWLVGTASGWAPQCRAHQLSGATGWAPIQVRMTEATAGYCAVLDVQANQETDIYSPSAPETGVDQPFVSLNTAASGSNGDEGFCNGGQSYVACEVDSNTPPGRYALLVYPDQVPLPMTFSFQGVCRFGCPSPPVNPVITSVKPATGPAGSVNELVVNGTALNYGIQVELASDANVVATATPVSLDADGALTVALNTYGVSPGKYDVAQFGVGYTVGVPSPGYLPGAYTVTAGPPAPAVGSFVPDGPVQILNTSTGLGGKKGPVRPGGVLTLTVAGVAGVPATNVGAVLVNVTAVQPARSGILTVYPGGAARPHVTDLSFSGGQASSDQVVVPVRDGTIELYNGSTGTTGLVVMLSGYFTSAGTHGLLTAVSPARILDTSTGLGAPKARLGAGQAIGLTVDGVGGVPKRGVRAVELNVAVLDPSGTGALTAFANGSARPGVGQLAFSSGQTTAGLITVPVRDGKVNLYNGSPGPVGLIADVTGYFSGNGVRVEAIGQARVLDTRTGLGGAGISVLAHSAAELNVDDLPGRQGPEQDVALSVTVLDAGAGGSLTVFGDGSAVPADPNLVFRAGQQITVEVIVPMTGGTIDFYNNSGGTIQIVADVQGYGLP